MVVSASFLLAVIAASVLGRTSEAFAIDGMKALLPRKNRESRAVQRLSDAVETHSVTFGEVVQESPTEFAALVPGTVVLIKIGNLELARKAWKKRRRSGSPLLLPCSVLEVDRQSMVISSFVYLLQKFGRPLAEQAMIDRPTGYRSKDIGLSIAQLCDLHRKHLQSPLKKHGIALGYGTPNELLRKLFTIEKQERYGVKLWVDNDTDWLVTHKSSMHGHRLAAQSVLLEFRDTDTAMAHTGRTRVKMTGDRHFLKRIPLSAALRVSQSVVDDGQIAEGRILPAIITTCDPTGDAGNPLLKLSLNQPRKVTNSRRPRKKNRTKETRLLELRHDLKDLKRGDGPFSGKIVKVSRKGKAAHIDIGVGRLAKKAGGSHMVRVLGVLREEIMTVAPSGPVVAEKPKTPGRDNVVAEEKHQRKEKIHGVVRYTDDEEEWEEVDEEGGIEVLDAVDVDTLFREIEEEKMEKMQDEIDIALRDAGYTEEDERIAAADPEDADYSHLFEGEEVYEYLDDKKSLRMITGTTDEESPEEDAGLLELSKKLFKLNEASDTLGPDEENFRVGDDVEVYIKGISKHDGKFVLTTDSRVTSMKETKLHTNLSKKFQRLVKQVDGGIERIMELKGTYCKGVVKAVSHKGDWIYVKPLGMDLPVGVGRDARRSSAGPISSGDFVRVRLEGVDESRGQLAMTVTRKFEE